MTRTHSNLKLNFASLICATLILFVVISRTKGDCPLNFLQLYKKCYYFSHDVESWRNAHFRCQAMNSSLITLRSKHNFKRLTDYLQREHLHTKEWWIGAEYDWKKKHWIWGMTGKPVKENYFIPEVKKSKLEWNCAFLDQRYGFDWNADRCTRKKYYICMQNNNDEMDYDKDNQVPLIVSRDLLEEQHLKGGDVAPGYIKQLNNRLQPKQKPKPQRRFVCPKGFGYVRNTCYKFSKTLATWQEAYFNCRREANGTLAIIPDKKYDRGVRRYAKRIGANIHERWIGGIYDWQMKAWKWANNGIIIQHQEKDKELLQWHCLIWNPLITDKWTSDACIIKKHYICQTAAQAFVAMEIRTRPVGPPQTRTKVTDKKGSNVHHRAHDEENKLNKPSTAKQP